MVLEFNLFVPCYGFEFNLCLFWVTDLQFDLCFSFTMAFNLVLFCVTDSIGFILCDELLFVTLFCPNVLL